MGLGAIIKGHAKELLNKDQTLFEKRMEICNKCGLKTEDKILGNVCSRHKWLNLETNEVSDTKEDGFYNGCGCRLNAKLRIEEATCPLNKW